MYSRLKSHVRRQAVMQILSMQTWPCLWCQIVAAQPHSVRNTTETFCTCQALENEFERMTLLRRSTVVSWLKYCMPSRPDMYSTPC